MRLIKLTAVVLFSIVSTTSFLNAQGLKSTSPGIVEGDLQCRFLSAIEQGFLSQHVNYSVRDSALQELSLIHI